MGMLNKVFLGIDIFDGIKKTRNAFNDTNNKYHDILGNQIIKAPAEGGQMNALNSNNNMYRMASEQIDLLFEEMKKEAGFNDIKKKIVDKALKADADFAKNIDDFVKFKELYKKTGDVKYKKQMIDAVKNVSKVGIPASAIAVGVTAGTVKGLDKLEKKFSDKNKNDESYHSYIAGGALLGSAVYDAMSNKSLLSPIRHIGKSSKNVLYKYPKKIIANTGKAGRFIVDIADAVKSQLKNNIKKKASEEIDDIFFQKTANVKDFVVKNFVQEGIASIPYMAAPAAVSYAIKRDIRHGGAKIKNTYDDKIVIDIPNETLDQTQKTAGIHKPFPWDVFLKEELPARAVQGVSRSLFPTAVVAVTGRNITNAMEKVNNNNKLDPVEPGKTRIIIQTSIPDEEIKTKKASEIIDDLFEVVASDDKPSSDAEKDAEKTIKLSVEGKKKDLSTLTSIDLAEGIKKQQRMLR